jgi:hypothetical protein
LSGLGMLTLLQTLPERTAPAKVIDIEGEQG